MSALDDIHDRRRLIEAADRELAALAAAYPDGPPEDHPEEPMLDGDVLAAVTLARRLAEQAKQQGGHQ